MKKLNRVIATGLTALTLVSNIANTNVLAKEVENPSVITQEKIVETITLDKNFSDVYVNINFSKTDVGAIIHDKLLNTRLYCDLKTNETISISEYKANKLSENANNFLTGNIQLSQIKDVINFTDLYYFYTGITNITNEDYILAIKNLNKIETSTITDISSALLALSEVKSNGKISDATLDKLERNKFNIFSQLVLININKNNLTKEQLANKYNQVLINYKVDNIFDAVAAKYMVNFIKEYSYNIKTDFTQVIRDSDIFIQEVNENNLYYKLFSKILPDQSILQSYSIYNYSFLSDILHID